MNLVGTESGQLNWPKGYSKPYCTHKKKPNQQCTHTLTYTQTKKCTKTKQVRKQKRTLEKLRGVDCAGSCCLGTDWASVSDGKQLHCAYTE